MIGFPPVQSGVSDISASDFIPSKIYANLYVNINNVDEDDTYGM